MEKIKRIFTCERGHSYESKNCISNGNGLPCGVADAVFLFGFIPILPPRIIYNTKANDMCKICSAPIIKEDDYVDGKIVMGARRI